MKTSWNQHSDCLTSREFQGGRELIFASLGVGVGRGRSKLLSISDQKGLIIIKQRIVILIFSLVEEGKGKSKGFLPYNWLEKPREVKEAGKEGTLTNAWEKEEATLSDQLQ